MKEDGFFKNVIRYVYHRRKTFFIAFIMVGLLLYAVLGKKGLLQRYELEMENRALKEKLKNEQERTLMLQKEIEDLKTSDKKIEKVAREKYGMAKDGEDIYKIVIDSNK
ncbi:MAG TPA: septum formation initiator family protein [Ignavibacteria bacterium]|jgi:cell division protein FtsB